MTAEGRNIGTRGNVHYRQRLAEHVPVGTDKQVTVDKLLGTLFSLPSLQNGYKNLVR
jgi:hypothetical protein